MILQSEPCHFSTLETIYISACACTDTVSDPVVIYKISCLSHLLCGFIPPSPIIKTRSQSWHSRNDLFSTLYFAKFQRSYFYFFFSTSCSAASLALLARMPKRRALARAIRRLAKALKFFSSSEITRAFSFLCTWKRRKKWSDKTPYKKNPKNCQ